MRTLHPFGPFQVTWIRMMREREREREIGGWVGLWLHHWNDYIACWAGLVERGWFIAKLVQMYLRTVYRPLSFFHYLNYPKSFMTILFVAKKKYLMGPPHTWENFCLQAHSSKSLRRCGFLACIWLENDTKNLTFWGKINYRCSWK